MNAFHKQVLPIFNATRAGWLEQARRVAFQLASPQNPVTTDDIHEFCPPPSTIDPRVMGAVFSGKMWLKVGYIQSKRKACHNRPIAIFQLRQPKH